MIALEAQQLQQFQMQLLEAQKELVILTQGKQT